MATILVVDDYTPSHRLLLFMLEQSGYAVLSAFNGLQALEALERMPVNLIVTDLTMPHLDGMGLTAMVRAHPRLHDLPIIMVTASGREADSVEATGVGVDAFLTKPIDSEDLAHTVRRLLARALHDQPVGTTRMVG